MSMSSYGWSAFDAEIVGKLHRRDPDVLDTSVGGGMRCPLVSHDCWLPWNSDYKNGTQPHGDPAVSVVLRAASARWPRRSSGGYQRIRAFAVRGWKRFEYPQAPGSLLIDVRQCRR